ncbi:MAG: hypothetical protein CMG62_11170, partial [Candidatus Marinimicrobia bacterium]|nr:hypothetical protein [Candidatus Neomarinimicrobiota bacterium]
MRVILTFLFLFAILIGMSSESPKVFNGFLISEGSSGKKITFNNPGFQLKEITKDGVSFHKPEMENSGSLSSPGEPFLPSTS